VLRIRLFKVLLPLVFIAVLALLVWAIRPQPQPRRTLPPDTDVRREVQGGTFRQYTLGDDGTIRKSLELDADRTAECGDLCYEAFGVKRFELPREGQEPLEISAVSTQITGPDGQRKMQFVGPVKIVDHELGLILDLPHLDVDEVAGVARSTGALHIAGANHQTRAERLVYGLAGQATELFRLECQDDAGGLLLAERGFLHDGLDDIELVQGVRFRRGDAESLRAETSRVLRREDGRFRHLTAGGKVVAGFRVADGFVEAAGDTIDASWNDAGDVSELLIDGRAQIEQGERMISAGRLSFRATPGAGWLLDAENAVRLAIPTEEGLTRLRAERLNGTVDADLAVLAAEARGAVRFEAPQTQADGAAATLAPHREVDDEFQIELTSAAGQRARVAQSQSRVTADRISIDTSAGSLHATGRVESTLLPRPDSTALDGLFRTDKAVHFISAELAVDQQGQRLHFLGDVRGWQGEQNLSAQEVVLEQSDGSLEAQERVTTRFPRKRAGSAAGVDDFIQITSRELEYRESDYRAVYRGNVRVVVAEGWIESEVLTVLQDRGEGGFERLLAEKDVRIEFRDEVAEATASRTTGHADRLDYLPAEETLWLYGDEQRAEIQRGGDQAGTSRGKVLTYRLSDGTLTVEGGTISAPPPAAARTNDTAEDGIEQETPE
jgi:lipopolysaccharide transport protein LptA